MLFLQLCENLVKILHARKLRRSHSGGKSGQVSYAFCNLRTHAKRIILEVRDYVCGLFNKRNEYKEVEGMTVML